MKKFAKKVIIGGTFDFLHAGHKALIAKAFELGEVTIGLVSDKMASDLRGRKIGERRYRQKELEMWINREIGRPANIIEIDDKFGSTLEQDFNCIVVSPETYDIAVLINQERQNLNKKPIEIVKIEFVLAQDGKPISSTRIFNGEIDPDGKLLR